MTVATPPARRPLGAVVWPRDTYDRGVCREATLGAREGWRRAYEGEEPSRAEHALRMLAPYLEDLLPRGNGAPPAVRSAA